MRYNLGKYRYDNYKIYKQVWWFIYKCVDEGPYSSLEGIKEVNTLCGVVEVIPDYSKLIRVDPDNGLEGTFLVNFKKPERFFGNDPLPATIYPSNGVLQIDWENGWTCRCDCNEVNIFKIEEILGNS